MIRNIQRTWFEVWGTEEAQNHFLKSILVFFIGLCLVQSIALVVLSLRKPPIIAVSSTESRVLTITPPNADLLASEVKRVANGYVSARYTWDWNKIEESFNAASKYVASDFTKRFLAANEDQIKVAKEKKLSERLYVAKMSVDLASKVATISGDRILVIDGLRAANPMMISLQFDYGPRTESNPEGIYVTGEKVDSQNSQGGV